MMEWNGVASTGAVPVKLIRQNVGYEDLVGEWERVTSSNSPLLPMWMKKVTSLVGLERQSGV